MGRRQAGVGTAGVAVQKDGHSSLQDGGRGCSAAAPSAEMSLLSRITVFGPFKWG